MQEVFEKIIEKLERQSVKTIPTCAVDGYSMTEEESMIFTDKAIEIVKQVSEEYNNGWIPCSERFPEEDGFYLATLDGEIVGEEKPFSGLAEFENGKWIDDEEDYQCVLAWQPLPEPYQPKGE